MLPSWRYISIHSSAVFSNCFFSISRRRNSVVHADGGNILEPLILEQVPKANGLEMALDVWDPLIGVLEPCAVLGPHGNVSDGGEASAAGSPGKRCGSMRRSCIFTSPPSPTLLSWGEARFWTMLVWTHCPRPQRSRTRRAPMIPRTAAWLACQLPVYTAEYTGPSRVGCPCKLSIRPALAARHPRTLYPAERPLPKARDGAVDQPRVQLRQGVIRQPPVSHVSGTEGLYQHISLAGELDGLLAAFCSAEIQHNAFLPAVP